MWPPSGVDHSLLWPLCHTSVIIHHGQLGQRGHRKECVYLCEWEMGAELCFGCPGSNKLIINKPKNEGFKNEYSHGEPMHVWKQHQ